MRGTIRRYQSPPMMEHWILKHWDDYVKMCKAEDKEMAKHTGHKRNSWMQEKNVYYGKPTKARLYPRDLATEARCQKIVDLHEEGNSWQTIADLVGYRIQNVARILKQRGYEHDVRP